MNECPDPETLAAWADDGLGADERSRVELHAASCARCQAQFAAMARMASADAAAIAPPSPAYPWRWLVPAAAGMTAVALWILMVPPPAPAPPPAPSSPAATLEDRVPALTVAPPDLAKRRKDQPEEKEADQRANTDSLLKQESRLDRRARDRNEPPPAASAPMERQQSMTALRELVPTFEIVSPEPAVRWRVIGRSVERSVDAGASWQAQSIGVAADLTAGSSPSTTVVWLAGRAGTVLLSPDGLTWRRVPFPESVDLTGVQATDASHATVTTADGRTFSTSDAATWVRR